MYEKWTAFHAFTAVAFFYNLSPPSGHCSKLQFLPCLRIIHVWSFKLFLVVLVANLVIVDLASVVQVI